MRAFKFLTPGAVGLFSDVTWPPPENLSPGVWVEAGGPLEPCHVGVHAARGATLLEWMDEELWRIELAGEVMVDEQGVLVAERGRLVSRVAGWNPAMARALTRACVDRLHARARVAGEAAAPALRVALADVSSLAEGARPDSGIAPHPGAAPPPAHIAANVSYVVAHVLAATDPERDLDTAFAAERAWQLAWLADRLDWRDPEDPGTGLFE